ncbi:lipid-binding protein [Pontibacter mangrovi]|uniref:Lipid-binding hydrolase n=1 Tax=Pontibacter mangrovi TaxID=2589816 RepID=A0A501WDX2_9BACT|nr:lipid-binding protein [Pontibacter mangrovi]TPE43716.1 hypothetical protein FJM65_13310 [Pontibacter mangrovi]
MKLTYTLLLVLFLALGFLPACDDDDDVEYTATYPVSGDWTVTYSVETAPGQFEPLVEDTELLIYNTAANVPTEVWVDDQENFWTFIIRTDVNMSNLTFSAQNAVSTAQVENADGELEPYDIEVNITDGQVFEDAVTVNGVQRDSIYFKVSFEDDDPAFGTVYHVYGHRSTGFE